MNDQTNADSSPIHTVTSVSVTTACRPPMGSDSTRRSRLASTDNVPLVVRGTDSIGFRFTTMTRPAAVGGSARRCLRASPPHASNGMDGAATTGDRIVGRRRPGDSTGGSRSAPRPATITGRWDGLPHPADEHLRCREDRGRPLLNSPRYQRPARRTRCRRSSADLPGQIRTVGARTNHVLARQWLALKCRHRPATRHPCLMSPLLPESQRLLGPIAR